MRQEVGKGNPKGLIPDVHRNVHFWYADFIHFLCTSDGIVPIQNFA